jgi:hypothetical protein
MSALDKQEGGSHYKDFAIQPIVFIHENKLGFLEGCVIKRMCRWQNKAGIADLRKAIHEIELLIELTELAEKRGLQEGLDRMKREHMSREEAEQAKTDLHRRAMERVAVRLGHPMIGDSLTPEAEQAVRDFLAKGDQGNPFTFPARPCTCDNGGLFDNCDCPPAERDVRSMDPSYPELPLGAVSEAAVYDRGNPHHYRLTPGLKLPSDLPDGTVVEEPKGTMLWERVGVMHRGQLVRDPKPR